MEKKWVTDSRNDFGRDFYFRSRILERAKAGFTGGFFRNEMGKAGLEYWKGLLGGWLFLLCSVCHV